jgi:hypothetical protein
MENLEVRVPTLNYHLELFPLLRMVLEVPVGVLQILVKKVGMVAQVEY